LLTCQRRLKTELAEDRLDLAPLGRRKRLQRLGDLIS